VVGTWLVEKMKLALTKKISENFQQSKRHKVHTDLLRFISPYEVKRIRMDGSLSRKSTFDLLCFSNIRAFSDLREEMRES